VGIFLLYAEFNRPGTILFGCFGILSLTLGLDGLIHLPLAAAALAAILASLPLLALGVYFPRFNLWTTLSGMLLGIGLARLTPGVDAVVAWAAAILFTAITTWLLRVALRARRNKLPQPLSGRESIRPHVQHTVDAPATHRPTA
jgi:membrane-bound ClpP family serine protease